MERNLGERFEGGALRSKLLDLKVSDRDLPKKFFYQKLLSVLNCPGSLWQATILFYGLYDQQFQKENDKKHEIIQFNNRNRTVRFGQSNQEVRRRSHRSSRRESLLETMKSEMHIRRVQIESNMGY